MGPDPDPRAGVHCFLLYRRRSGNCIPGIARALKAKTCKCAAGSPETGCRPTSFARHARLKQLFFNDFAQRSGIRSTSLVLARTHESLAASGRDGTGLFIKENHEKISILYSGGGCSRL